MNFFHFTSVYEVDTVTMIFHLRDEEITIPSPCLSLRCYSGILLRLLWCHLLRCLLLLPSLQSCLTLCDPIDGSPPGSAIPVIPQARTLEWVAISFSNAGKWKVKVKSLSRVWLLATSWTTAYQAPLPMGFSRQEYWSGVPLPSPLRCLGWAFGAFLGKKPTQLRQMEWT